MIIIRKTNFETIVLVGVVTCVQIERVVHALLATLIVTLSFIIVDKVNNIKINNLPGDGIDGFGALLLLLIKTNNGIQHKSYDVGAAAVVDCLRGAILTTNFGFQFSIKYL